jgi:hypothetical protein
VDQESEARDAYIESLQEQHQEAIKQWLVDVKEDKELGGENFEKSVELAKNVVKRFGTEAFMEDLDKSGYGNHPEVVRTFARIGRAMSNDELVRPGKHSGGEKSMEDIFYSNSN